MKGWRFCDSHHRTENVRVRPAYIEGARLFYNTNIEDREVIEDRAQFFIECILGKLDFAHVKVTNAADFEVFVDDLEDR